MTPDTRKAIEVILSSEDSCCISSIVADLAVRTPSIIYASRSLGQSIGHPARHAAFVLAAWDLCMLAGPHSFEGECSYKLNGEKIEVFYCSPAVTLEPHHSDEIRIAIGILSTLSHDDLRQALGVLIDACHECIVVHETSFIKEKQKGMRHLVANTAGTTPPETSFRYSGRLLLAGRPGLFHLCQVAIRREGGPAPVSGQPWFQFAVDGSCNDQPRAMRAPSTSKYG